jgi:hypothetical protein
MARVRVLRHPDGKFLLVGDTPDDGPLGVSASVDQAIGTAVREATGRSRTEGCRVLLQIEPPNGTFKTEQIVNPPVAVRHNPRTAKLEK